MSKYEMKDWYEVWVDGRCIAVTEDSEEWRDEFLRINGLAGVEVKPATKENILKLHGKSKLPPAMLGRNTRAAKKIMKSRQGKLF